MAYLLTLKGNKYHETICFESLSCSHYCLRPDAQKPVTYDRLTNAAKEPQNWLMYGGNYSRTATVRYSDHYPANVKNLNLSWVYQSPVAGSWADDADGGRRNMYLTQRLNDVVALERHRPRVLPIDTPD